MTTGRINQVTTLRGGSRGGGNPKGSLPGDAPITGTAKGTGESLVEGCGGEQSPTAGKADRGRAVKPATRGRPTLPVANSEFFLTTESAAGGC
jgi:hypothetical protein